MSKTNGKSNGYAPTHFRDDLWVTICQRISEGESIRAISDEDGMPSRVAINSWLHKWSGSGDEDDARRLSQYARARQTQAAHYAAEVIEIADGCVGSDSDGIQAARVQIDARKWYAGKLAPKVYGTIPPSVSVDARSVQVSADPATIRALLGVDSQNRLADTLDALGAGDETH